MSYRPKPCTCSKEIRRTALKKNPCGRSLGRMDLMRRGSSRPAVAALGPVWWPALRALRASSITSGRPLPAPRASPSLASLRRRLLTRRGIWGWLRLQRPEAAPADSPDSGTRKGPRPFTRLCPRSLPDSRLLPENWFSTFFFDSISISDLSRRLFF